MTTPRQQLVADIATRIAGIHRPHPVRVALDGVDAAGKTTLADELAIIIEGLGRPVIRASIDGFHNPQETRRRRGPLSPQGYYRDSFDYPGLLEALLLPLGPGGFLAFRRAVFDYRTDEPVQASVEQASSHAVLIFDGVFLLRPELRGHFDFSIFVRADFDVTLKRAESRDVHLFGSIEAVRHRYQHRYIPGQQLYINEAQPERSASIVIDNNDPAQPVIVGAIGDRQ